MTSDAALPPSKPVDMSPEAIDRRIWELAQLYKLGMSLRGAKLLGPVEPHDTPGTNDKSEERT